MIEVSERYIVSRTKFITPQSGRASNEAEFMDESLLPQSFHATSSSSNPTAQNSLSVKDSIEYGSSSHENVLKMYRKQI